MVTQEGMQCKGLDTTGKLQVPKIPNQQLSTQFPSHVYNMYVIWPSPMKHERIQKRIVLPDQHHAAAMPTPALLSIVIEPRLWVICLQNMFQQNADN